MLNSPQSSIATFSPLSNQLKGCPKSMLGIINPSPRIDYIAIIAMQGHRVNIRKCPCIARFFLSWRVMAHYLSQPIARARSHHDGNHRRLFWPPYLPHLSFSTHQTLKAYPLTFNVNGDVPITAIAAPFSSVFLILSLTGEKTKFGSSTTSTALISSIPASATAPLPPTPCHCISVAFATDSG